MRAARRSGKFSGKVNDMAALGDPLFYRRDQVDLDAVLRHRVHHLRQMVDDLPDEVFSAKTDEEIAGEIARSAAMNPLEVDFSAAIAHVEEAPIEVRDPFGFERGPVRVAGLKATKVIPFKG